MKTIASHPDVFAAVRVVLVIVIPLAHPWQSTRDGSLMQRGLCTDHVTIWVTGLRGLFAN